MRLFWPQELKKTPLYTKQQAAGVTVESLHTTKVFNKDQANASLKEKKVLSFKKDLKC